MNWILVFIAAFFLVPKIPNIIDMYKTQGTKADTVLVQTINNDDIAIPRGKKSAVIFWATWCGPCEIELMRVNRLINAKKIPSDSVLAISLGEAFEDVNKHAVERGYKFLVGLDLMKTIANKYKILVTPTILLIDENGKIEWKTAGLSPTLELRLINYLK